MKLTPVEIIEPITPSIPPYFYNNVQIIGPKPVYITYNKVVGASVSNYNYGKKVMKPLQDRDDQAFIDSVYKYLNDD